MTDVLRFVTQAVLVLVFGLATYDYLRHRERRRLDAALMLGALAVIIVVQWLQGLALPLPGWSRQASVIALLAHPYLLLRLVAHARPVSRLVQGAAVAGMVGSWVITLAFPPPAPVAATLAIIVYFAAVEAFCGIALATGAFAARGAERRQLALAASGSVLLALVIALAGVAAALPAWAPTIASLSPVLSALAAIAYYLGFAPPGWMRDSYRSLPLAGRLVPFVALAVALTAAGSAGSVTWQLSEAWTAEVAQHQQSLASLAGETVAQYLRGIRQAVTQAASRQSLQEATASEEWNLEVAQRTVDGLALALPNVQSAALLDQRGDVKVISLPDKSVVGRNFAHREYFQGAVRTGGAYLASPIVGAALQRPTLIIAAPVTGGDGTLRGVIFVGVDVQAFSLALPASGTASITQISLVAPSGVVAVHPDASRLMKPASEETGVAAAAAAGQTGVVTEEPPLGGPRRLVAYAPVPDSNREVPSPVSTPTEWAVLVSAPADEILSPIHSGITRASSLALGLVAVLTLISAVFAARQFRPLKAMTAAAGQFGGGNYSHRVPVEGAADLRELATRFNTMADAVGTNAESLEAQRAEAERRAEERTALAELVRTVADEESVAGVARHVVGFIDRLIPSTTCGLLLPRGDGSLEVVARGGFDAARREGDVLPPGKGISGRALRAGATVVSEDVRQDPDYVALVPHMRSAVAVPLQHRGHVVGVLTFESDRAAAYGASEVAIAEILAGHVALALARVQLLDELKQQNAELQAASRHKSEFLANMSHELRTPLNAINGFSQLLLTAAEDEYRPEVRRKYLETIREAGEHLLQLINDILDLSKVEAGKMELRPEALDVDATVGRVVATIRPLADAKGILLRAETARGGSIMADEGRFKQILYNLLSNAVKFTDPGGAVAVLAEQRGAVLRLTVADSGIGIAPAHHARIFEEFSQVDAGPGRRYEGTGLGLALTRKIVELHGGRIWVESAPGEGSQFHIELPLQTEAPALETSTGAPALRPSLSGTTADEARRGPPVGDGPLVLVVEDDPRAANLLEIYLTRGGFRTAVAVNGREALDRARLLRPLVIILDILLPELDGWEVLRSLKDDPTTRDIPVVIASVVDDQHLGYALGATDYLVKPIDGDMLLARLGRFTFTTKVRHGPVRVLVVDDDPAVRELIGAVLSPLGFTVTTASGGAEAIRLAREQRPDLVLLDLMMPEVNGFDVVTALRAGPLTRGAVVVIVTAKDLSESEKRMLNGHVAAIFQKGGGEVEGLLEWVHALDERLAAPLPGDQSVPGRPTAGGTGGSPAAQN